MHDLESSQFIGCGAQYDPVFWDRATQIEHVRQMKEAGLSFVRLFEFCWSSFEPEEEQYEFAWADDFVELLRHHEINFILCTPGAVPPRWLTVNYPETTVMQSNGQRDRGDMRRHGCASSPVFMHRLIELCHRLAERYGQCENLLAWQIDNELGHPYCYCPLCQDRFRQWLQDEYDSLDEVNQRLGMRVWGREYSAWEGIHIPVANAAPQLRHAFRRWTSRHWIQYVQAHTEVIRNHSQAPITTNMMAPWHGYDHYDMSREIDIVGMDYYVYGEPGPDRFGYCNPDMDFNLGYTRGLGDGAPFWIMETDVAGGGGKLPPAGKLAEWTWRHIAHGANLINYFRWDCPPFGREELNYGVVGPGTWPSPAADEVKKVCMEIKKYEPVLQGTRPRRAPVALLFSFPAWWKWLDNPPCKPLGKHPMHSYPFMVRRHCHGLLENGLTFDVVGPDQDWQCYPILIIPHCLVMNESLMQRCEKYVDEGGTLLLTALSALYNDDGRAYNAPYPAAPLHQLCGVTCPPYGNLVPDARPSVIPLQRQELHPDGWLDALSLKDTEVKTLLRCKGGCRHDWPVLTKKSFGKGTVFYLGTVLPLEEMPVLYDLLAKQWGLQRRDTLPDAVWMRSRVAADGRMVHIVQNMGNETAVVNLPGLELQEIPAHKTKIFSVTNAVTET
ncbi:MAG: beta-galactosidase [Candidatus Pacebacteria bacterium]|nr:beta-galactosidase [Candidatus Paceibacterota bacterium]